MTKRRELGVAGTVEALRRLPPGKVKRSKPPHMALIKAVEDITGGLTTYNDLVAALRRY